MASPTLVKAYWFPLILFAASLFFQLILLPRSYPPSHYDVLGIKTHTSVEDVTEAYERLSSKWTAGTEVPPTVDFVKIRYAFELLTNPLWKRDYDVYGVDEQIHVIAKVQEQYSKTDFSEIDLPLLEPAVFDPKDQDFNLITSRDFRSKFENSKPLLLQVFSFGSNRCAEFSDAWKRIAALLEGVATTGMVELGEVQLAKYLAEKTFTGQPSFQNGVPSLVVFPSGCNASSCLVRYEGELSVDAVTDWFATRILSLPRILYYSKESLAQRFLAKASPHKVKVIFFSETGERATPFVRKAAQDYWPYATFAYVLWREQDSSVWWNTFGVESAPAVVLLRESGVKPVVYHGPANESWFLNIMEQNKHQELPQLRSVTSMELGCDARGYSRAGNETGIWYCAILTGRQSQELAKMRETIRRVHQELSSDDKLDTIGENHLSPPVVALKEKRLTFTWLDGEAQQRYCFFLVQSPTSYDTCGTRKDIVDLPQLVIVRFKRNATEDSIAVEKKPRNIFEALQDNDVDPASQLVARYNGSEDTSEIIKWISQIIEDGDSKDLPFFRAKAPELVPEDADPIWSKGARSVMSKGTGIKQKISSVVIGTRNRLEDPRIGPVLLLGALMSFGNIWLRRNRTQPTAESQPRGRDEDRQNRRRKSRNVLNQDLPPSLTDMEPKDAFQLPLSDSD